MSKRNKGRRKPSTRDLLRHWPTREEMSRLLDQVDDRQHPIVVAILGATLIEHELERLLRGKFRNNDDTTWARITTENGGLASFSQKINIAYAFGLIDENRRVSLLAIKNIRNSFAHSKKPISFEDIEIVEELATARFSNRNHDKLFRDVVHIKGDGPVTAFINLCLRTSIYLTNRYNLSLSAKLRNLERKKVSSLARAFQTVAAETLGQSGVGSSPADPITLNGLLRQSSSPGRSAKASGIENK